MGDNNIMNQLPECDFCENTHEVKSLQDGIKACKDCIAKGVVPNTSRIAPTPETPAIGLNEVLKQSREVDNRVEVRTDLFNAETVSIQDLKKAIDTDESITNKPFALATELHTRYTQFKKIIFELNEEIVEATNKQKAIQVYLNQLANQLRQEEREKLKIQDINYKPREIKPSKPRATKKKKVKFDKVELRKYASELGIPEFALQVFCVGKGLSLEEGYKMFKANIDSAKEQTNG